MTGMRMVITRRNFEAITAGHIGPASATPTPDSYRERLMKYIPVEMVVLYVAVYGITYAVAVADPLFPLAARWILIAGIVATPVYLLEGAHVTDWVQLVISTFGFFLWACALGVIPLSDLQGYNQILASVALPVYVFVSPLIEGIPDRW